VKINATLTGTGREVVLSYTTILDPDPPPPRRSSLEPQYPCPDAGSSRGFTRARPAGHAGIGLHLRH
jgi:hypothetical protein